MMDIQTKFRIVLDPEKETWLQKLEGWAASQKPPISFLLSIFVVWLKEFVIEYKVQRELISVDEQAKKIVEQWEAEDPQPIITVKPSEVDGLDDISISAPWKRE
jgi:hypothetical protein